MYIGERSPLNTLSMPIVVAVVGARVLGINEDMAVYSQGAPASSPRPIIALINYRVGLVIGLWRIVARFN